MDYIAFIISLIKQYFQSMVIPVIIAVAITLAIYATVRLSLSRSNRAEEFKKSIMTVVKGPIPVAIIGYAFVLIGKRHPAIFPPPLNENYVIFIVELLILLTAINASRKMGTILVKEFLKLGDTGKRFLLLGIYSMGMITLFYIIFTSPISPPLEASSFQIVAFITGVVATYIIVYIVNLIVIRYQRTIHEDKPQLNTTITFGRRVIIGVVGALGVAASGFSAFPHASGAIASIFVAAGFTSIVLGLAAQSSLSNLIAGGVISFSQPFQINDAIIFDGQYCFVEDIKLVFTVLRTWDGRRMMVPNNQFLNTTIVNYNAVDTTKVAVIYIEITLESDVEKAMEIMKNVIAGHPLFYPAEGFPSALVMQFDEYGVQLRALGRAKDQSDNWTLEKESLLQIKKEFDQNGIKIAVPRREIVYHNRDDVSKDPRKGS